MFLRQAVRFNGKIYIVYDKSFDVLWLEAVGKTKSVVLREMKNDNELIPALNETHFIGVELWYCLLRSQVFNQF